MKLDQLPYDVSYLISERLDIQSLTNVVKATNKRGKRLGIPFQNAAVRLLNSRTRRYHRIGMEGAIKRDDLEAFKYLSQFQVPQYTFESVVEIFGEVYAPKITRYLFDVVLTREKRTREDFDTDTSSYSSDSGTDYDYPDEP